MIMYIKTKGLFMISVLLILIVSQSFTGQVVDENQQSLLLIKKIYSKLNNSKEYENKVFYCKMGVKTILDNSFSEEDNNKEELVEIIINKNQSRFISDKVIVYEDNKESYTIIHHEKKLIRADSKRMQVIGRNNNQLSFLQDTILKVSHVMDVSTITINGESLQKVVTTVPKESNDYFNIEHVVYYINIEQREIKKIELRYLKPNQHIKEVQYRFVNLDYNYKVLGMNKSVKSLIFSDNSNLKQGLKGYQIIDIRKSK